MSLFWPFITTNKWKISKSCAMNVAQQQQLRIHIDLFLYMKYAKRFLQHFARFFPLYILWHNVIPLHPFWKLTGSQSPNYWKPKVRKVLRNLALMDGQHKNEVQTAALEFVTLLYDPSNKERKYHFCLNKLALRKRNTIGKLPPCEDAFKQHVKRAMWQTKIWMSSHIECPDIGSSFDFRWKKEGAVLTPVLYEGLTTSEVISDLICICKGKDHCVVGCACFQNGFPCMHRTVLPILTNLAMQLQESSNMVIMKKKKKNIKIRRLCVQNKRLTGCPMNL